MKKFLAGLLATAMVFEMSIMPVAMALEHEDTNLIEVIQEQIKGEEDDSISEPMTPLDESLVIEVEDDSISEPMTPLDPDLVMVKGEEIDIIEKFSHIQSNLTSELLSPFDTSTIVDVKIGDGDNDYITFNKATGTVIDSNTDIVTADIPTLIDNVAVTTIGQEAFHERKSLKFLTLPESITAIKIDAFSWCSALTDVVLPSSLTVIEEAIFEECKALTSVKLGDFVTSIGKQSFSGCSSLIDILFPETLTSLDSYAFSGCGFITLTFPESLTSTGWSSFQRCTSLKTINFSDSQIEISSYSFQYCTDLEEVVIPEGITYIATGAFQNCSKLHTLHIPTSLKNIGYNLFYNCSQISNIYFAGSESEWNSFNWGTSTSSLSNATVYYGKSDSVNYDFEYEELDDGTLKIIGYNGSDTNLVIPVWDEILLKDITVIGESAFEGNTTLKEIEISYLITTIEESAFMNCASLEQVTIQPHVDMYLFCNLSVISANAFYNCSNLAAISFPNSIIEWEKIDIDSGAIDSSVNIIFSVINNSKFEFGTESSRFNNNKAELGDLYYISDEYRDILISKQGWSKWDSKYRDKIIDFSGSENKGLCFGTASIMALVKAKKVIPQYIDLSATTMFMIGETLTNEMISLFSYYHLLQWLDEFREHDLDKNDHEKATELIFSLADSSNSMPVFIVFDLGTDEGHAVLAYGIDATTDDDYYLVYIADPNFSDSPNVIKINKRDFSEVKYYITRKAVVNISLRYIISDLTIFNSHVTPNGALDEVQYIREYTSLTTYANSNFIIETEGKQAVFENGVLSEGTLDVQGPYGEIGLNESPTALVDYYFKSNDTVQIQYLDSDFINKCTIVNFADTLTVSFVDSTVNEISFVNNGEITFDNGDGSTSIIATAVEKSNVPWEATYVTSSATNLTLTPSSIGFDVTSTEILKDMEITCHTDVFTSQTLEVSVDTNDLYITSKIDEDTDAVYAVIVNKDEEVLDDVLMSGDGSEDNSGGNTEDTPDDNTEDTPDDNTEDTPDDNTGDTPDDNNTEDTPDDNTEDTPDDNTEDTPDSNTEDDSGSTGSSSSSTPTTYTNTIPTFDNGKVTASPSKPKYNETVTLTISPDSGYEVGEVVVKRVSNGTVIEVTENADGTYSFTQPYGTVSIDVEFISTSVSTTTTPEVETEETTTSFNFSDISTSDWFYEQVQFVAEKGLMNGTSTTEFSPLASTTRGMIVTILHSLAGYPEPTTTGGFDDVSSSDWYGNAVAWAKEVGITSGMTENTFDPNGFMTREQLVVMLYAYEKQFGDGGFTGLWAFPLDFTDSETISEWANEATAWCVMNNIVGGRDTGDFDPQAIANRAEVATILMNFVNLYS